MDTQIANGRETLAAQLQAAQARHTDITAIVSRAQAAALAAVLHVRDLEFAATRGVLLAQGPELASAKAVEYAALNKLDSARIHLDHAIGSVERAEQALRDFDAAERRPLQAEWVAENRPELAKATADAEAELARTREPVKGLQPDPSHEILAVHALDAARAALVTAIDSAPIEREMVHVG
jgi:hypothetical protein